jgi:Rhomboid family
MEGLWGQLISSIEGDDSLGCPNDPCGHVRSERRRAALTPPARARRIAPLSHRQKKRLLAAADQRLRSRRYRAFGLQSHHVLSFGFTLERVIGTARFTSLYFCGLLASGIGTCIKHRDEPNYTSLGASGAILAVLFASIVYFPRSRLLILPIPIPIPAPLFAVFYLGWSYYSSRNSKDRINHDAHIAGALTGVAFVALTDPQSFVALLRYLTR